jgi:hypothetical protein
MTITAVRAARADRKCMSTLSGSNAVELRSSGAVFPANISIVAEDDETRGKRRIEMFGYKFALALLSDVDVLRRESVRIGAIS